MKFTLICLIASASAIQKTFRPVSQESAPWYKPASVTHGALKPDFPINYPVPNFGVDHDIKASQNSLKISEKALGKTLHANFDQKTNAVNTRNYKVASFGVDHDIKASENSLKITEKALGHKLSVDGYNKEINSALKFPKK